MLDALILKIFLLIIKINYFRGDLSDISAKTATLGSSSEAFLAETSVSSPRRLVISIIKRSINRIKVFGEIVWLNLEKGFAGQQMAPSEAFFKIKLLLFLDTLILQIHFLIAKINYFRGDLSDISAKKATQMAPVKPLIEELLEEHN